MQKSLIALSLALVLSACSSGEATALKDTQEKPSRSRSTSPPSKWRPWRPALKATAP